MRSWAQNAPTLLVQAVVLGVLVLAACAMPCAADDSAEDMDAYLTPKNIARLEKGDVIVFKKSGKDERGKASGEGRVMALVNRPFDIVWEHLCRFEDHPQFMPRLVDIEMYPVDEHTRGMKETVSLPFMKVCYHVLQTPDKEAGTVAWRLDRTKENDINDTSGCWMLKPHGDDQCIVMYSGVADSGLFIPKVLENYLMKFNLPDIVKALKKRAESDGAYTKRGWKPRQ